MTAYTVRPVAADPPREQHMTPRSPNMRKAVADIPSIIDWLTSGPGRSLTEVCRPRRIRPKHFREYLIPAMTPEQYRTWRSLVNRKPISPAVVRAIADSTGLIRRMLDDPELTLRKVAAEYGCHPDSIQPHLIGAMTRKQRRRWYASSRSAKSRRCRWVPVGTVRTKDGRRWIKVRDVRGATGRNWMPLAKWKWESLVSPIPKGFVMLFKDGNPMHDDPENVEVVTYAEKVRRLGIRQTGWSGRGFVKSGPRGQLRWRRRKRRRSGATIDFRRSSLDWRQHDPRQGPRATSARR